MHRIKIPFDLKCGKLEADTWERKNMKRLAEQLFQNQGKNRTSVENRLYILFDRSTTSSTKFLELNEPLMKDLVLKSLREPEAYWFPVNYAGHQTLVCIILIPETAYLKLIEVSQHFVGTGLREPDKAEFHKRFIRELATASGGTIVPNDNEEEHGIDGYVFLPTSVCQTLLGEEAQL